jgi:hypothetical protein
MSIKIGDKNKIKNSSIGHQYGQNNGNHKQVEKSSAEKHPVIISFLVSLAVGFILLFSFWKNIVNWIENL